MTKSTFDKKATSQALREGKDLNGKGGILSLQIKRFNEVAMTAELNHHLTIVSRRITRADAVARRSKPPLVNLR